MKTDWKPDENKNCEKCKNWEPMTCYEAGPWGPRECDGLYCTTLFNYWINSEESDNPALYILSSYISDLHMRFLDGGYCDSEYEDTKLSLIVIANICPLYEQKNEE
ncbi:MAG: hypothetical protein LBU40_01875 [Methanobrevibacter sp.]|nr:hypothetical protein [Methanobrevibacter sp.]